MAAVEFDVDDMDDNHMIEDAIRKTLSQNVSATVDVGVINKLYRLPTDGDPPTSTVKERCGAIVSKLADLKLETFMTGNLAVFKPIDPRKPTSETEAVG